MVIGTLNARDKSGIYVIKVEEILTPDPAAAPPPPSLITSSNPTTPTGSKRRRAINRSGIQLPLPEDDNTVGTDGIAEAGPSGEKK